MVKKTQISTPEEVLGEEETLYTIQTKDESTAKILMQAKTLYFGVDELLNTVARWRNKGWADTRFVDILKNAIAESGMYDDEGVEGIGTLMEEDGDIVLFNINGALLADALYLYIKEVSEFKSIED
jgi:hypothetical protein